MKRSRCARILLLTFHASLAFLLVCGSFDSLVFFGRLAGFPGPLPEIAGHRRHSHHLENDGHDTGKLQAA